ncbi:hypothetical protein F2Q69_00048938 [Brassica cretica]|uniref:Uncharacterized protein n=1 Tax=Brassica cretica TaxID=69181 RepID=A0A8S9PZ29_BRACR|nr:hypothetical protein F2Q69_00048938 [Brassica cretica]
MTCSSKFSAALISLSKKHAAKLPLRSRIGDLRCLALLAGTGDALVFVHSMAVVIGGRVSGAGEFRWMKPVSIYLRSVSSTLNGVTGGVLVLCGEQNRPIIFQKFQTVVTSPPQLVGVLLPSVFLALYRELEVQVCFVGLCIAYYLLCLCGSWQEFRLFND